MVLTNQLSLDIWERKYRWKDEKEPLDSFKRVARAVGSNEKDLKWTDRFLEIMANLEFLPGGRILAGAGTDMRQTLLNCFTLPEIEDSIEGIFHALKLNAIIHSYGGGTGANFSTLRPAGSEVKTKGGIASGPVSFMTVFDAETRTITTGNSRKGANMGILNVDHPDIRSFIRVKRDLNILTQFNLSVGLWDEFLEAVVHDTEWELKFNGIVYEKLRAKELWEEIVSSAYEFGEPGILNFSTIDKMNNLWYIEKIRATNPCSEQPLPPYGCCLLGSINLVKFVKDPFSDHPSVDFVRLKEVVEIAVRFLDNVIDITLYPTQEYQKEEFSKRRIGLGIMGLGSMLAMMGITYASQQGCSLAEEIMRFITQVAYLTSVKLAKEKGKFELYDDRYLQSKFIQNLGKEVVDEIKKHGIRNSHLTSIAPTGSLSILAGNVSSGIEPIFSLSYERRVRKHTELLTDEYETYIVNDYAYELFKTQFKSQGNAVFQTAYEVSPSYHLEMLDRLSKWVDSSISKTINLPKNFPKDGLNYLLLDYLRRGNIKGLTIFREGTRQEILSKPKEYKKDFILNRPHKLKGYTYRIKTPKASYYITINDIEIDGVKRPYEIFINTKDISAIAWSSALTRVMSAVFRRETDLRFLVEQLKGIVDPNGGYWRDGKRIPSVLYDIAEVLEEHLNLKEEEDKGTLEQCPQCLNLSLIRQEGCVKCLTCGYSVCG